MNAGAQKQQLEAGRCYGMRPPQAAFALGSSELLRRARFHGWIVPVVAQKRLTLFDSGDVAALWLRIRGGELPPPVPRKG
jgi:hypothetical protein